MIEEIQAAVNFLTKLIARSESLDDHKIELLGSKFCYLLQQRFRDHWFPEDASRGQAYRCIRINELDRRDPSLEQACSELSIKYEDLKLPIELTIWVDPGEVACRFGEHKGSYCVVAKFHEGNQESYIDQINIEELEQKTRERNKQGIFDHRKKRTNLRGIKNGYNGLNGYSNGYHNDYSSVIPTTSSPGSFYPSYYNGSPYGSSFNGSPPNHIPYGQKYPSSPPTQSRSNQNTPFRGKLNGINGGYNQNNGTINGINNRVSRNLNNSFNGFGNIYSNNDRYHYFNKQSINSVKA